MSFITAASNESFLRLMDNNREQIDKKIYFHTMKASLIDCVKNDESEDMKNRAKNMLKKYFNYDVQTKSQEDEKYIFNASDHYEKVTDFGRLCYSILYIFVRNAIIQTRGKSK